MVYQHHDHTFKQFIYINFKFHSFICFNIHQKLYVGMKVLGAIKEVNEYDMVISLPNGLSGFVHITHINEKITEKLKEELEAGETKDSEVRYNCNVVVFIRYDSLCCQ